jgi:hypothetical protein
VPQQVAVLLGKGDGSFQPPALIHTATSGESVVIADLNGDGKPDLLLGDCCGLAEATYLLGKGDGTFYAEAQFPSGPNPNLLAVADLFGGAKPDFAIAGKTTNQGTLVLVRNFFAWRCRLFGPRRRSIAHRSTTSEHPRETTRNPSGLVSTTKSGGSASSLLDVGIFTNVSSIRTLDAYVAN